jgi:hypothetical protein
MKTDEWAYNTQFIQVFREWRVVPTLQAHFVSKNKSVEPLNINLEGRLGVES